MAIHSSYDIFSLPEEVLFKCLANLELPQLMITIRVSHLFYRFFIDKVEDFDLHKDLSERLMTACTTWCKLSFNKKREASLQAQAPHIKESLKEKYQQQVIKPFIVYLSKIEKIDLFEPTKEMASSEMIQSLQFISSCIGQKFLQFQEQMEIIMTNGSVGSLQNRLVRFVNETLENPDQASPLLADPKKGEKEEDIYSSCLSKMLVTICEASFHRKGEEALKFLAKELLNIRALPFKDSLQDQYQQQVLDPFKLKTNDIKRTLVLESTKSFTSSEINSCLGFLSSSAGKKFLQLQEQMETTVAKSGGPVSSVLELNSLQQAFERNNPSN